MSKPRNIDHFLLEKCVVASVWGVASQKPVNMHIVLEVLTKDSYRNGLNTHTDFSKI
jgi:hypothetical protein